MSGATMIHTRRSVDLSVLAQKLTTDEMSELVDVIETARQELSWAALPAMAEIHDFDAASRVLDQGWRAVVSRLEGLSRAEASVRAPDVSGLVSLLSRMTRVSGSVHEAQSRYQHDVMHAVEDELRRLEDLGSVEQFFDAGVRSLNSFGLDRGLASRFNGSLWVTESMYIEDDADWAREIVAAGKDIPRSCSPGSRRSSSSDVVARFSCGRCGT